MTPAAPYTSCANGCGIPAKWKVKRGGRTKNLCNACATRTKDCSSVKRETTRSHAERQRKHEVLERIGY